ncbi:MAG: NAD(P)-dependent oxidoreductase [Thomasclavelia spiroformis]
MIVYINGNDNRCKQLAKLMIADGYQIQEDSRLISSCDIIYLGKDGQGFEQVDFKNNAVVLSLLKNQRLCYLSKLKGFNYRYLYSDEDFVVENTHISDEAVIAYMIIDNSISLSNSNVLILGYGHCGRDLAAKLEKFNAKVSISNRSDHYHDEVVEKGYRYIRLDQLTLNGYDFVINTIPSQIIDSNILKTKDVNCKIYDVASTPYGLKLVIVMKVIIY